jgi:hypothetical protein
MDIVNDDIAEIEIMIKLIFNKPTCSDADVQLVNYYIKKWKILTNWKENTSPVLLHTI